VIAAPPFDAGAVHETVAEAAPAVAVTEVGAPANVIGVAGGDAEEYEPVPIAFVAATRNT
jgi:hypothetical protein